jgi:SNF2 family DNA or RNA helicase
MMCIMCAVRAMFILTNRILQQSNTVINVKRPVRARAKRVITIATRKKLGHRAILKQMGLQSLLEDPSAKNQSDNRQVADHLDAHNEMDNVAALAESIQPKGNTLLTTSVVTKIPFLLKHSLREYQHIGLDWLVTMYDRKLNGILADEMGLGKTIQTIALLAHLACEKGHWGPHLIIVPTSVMLNWEMECKKWCPGFKILTYYGMQKERKQKRNGLDETKRLSYIHYVLQISNSGSPKL